jgi:transcriptional regulator with XRE-family HTH domain
MNYKKEIGRRIRGGRNALELTLRELSAKTMGVLSASRISNYEQGLRMPSPKEALALGKALGLQASYILCLDGEDEMTAEETMLLRDWRGLPENQRKEYARRIGALALAFREPVADEKVRGYADPAKHQPKPAKARQKVIKP